MNKPILSAAIALPLVIASAASSFANDAAKLSPVTTAPVTTDTLKKPILSEPLIQGGMQVDSPQIALPDLGLSERRPCSKRCEPPDILEQLNWRIQVDPSRIEPGRLKK